MLGFEFSGAMAEWTPTESTVSVASFGQFEVVVCRGWAWESCVILCDSLILEIREPGCCRSPDGIRNGLCVILVTLFLPETSHILKKSNNMKEKKSVGPSRML